MGAEWIEYKGKKILYVKYGGLTPQERLELIHQATQMIVTAQSDQVLSLSDVTGCYLDQEFVNVTKQQSQVSLPCTKKAAVVGVTGLKQVLLMAVNNFSPKPRKNFDTVDEALEWLIRD